MLSTHSYAAVENSLNHVQVPANGASVLVVTSLMTPAPDPTILSVETEGDTFVTLEWTEVTGADGYFVYRTSLSGGGYELLGATAGLTYTDTTVEPGQRYYYIVKSFNGVTGLLSEASNEVSALPAYVIDWANLQWPFTIVHTIGTTPTENIFGRVYIPGVTYLPGATPGLQAQVGFGPNESDPRDNGDWIWFDATFNIQVDLNDEFVGTLLPETAGEFDYVYRYTTNGGVSWLYAYQSGPILDPYDPIRAGQLYVNPSLDTTPPEAPVLAVDNWSASSISLSWTAAIDDVEVYAYDLYRSTDNITFSKIDRVLSPSLTYTDTNVVTDQLYYYYVIALDTSFNASDPSNTVSQVAEAKLVAVTFEITVPEWTPGVVYIVGGHEAVGNWNPGAVAMTKEDDTLWTHTADILDGTAFEFKITRGNWETVMKGADGNEELANLPITVTYGTDGTQLYEYTVPNWRDPIVVATSPFNGALNVPLNSTIVITWSQAMPAATCPDVWIEPNVTDLIPVTCSFDPATNELTITPTASLPSLALIGIGLSGLGDAGGDTQQVSYPLFFTTEFVDPLPIKSYLPVILR